MAAVAVVLGSTLSLLLTVVQAYVLTLRVSVKLALPLISLGVG